MQNELITIQDVRGRLDENGNPELNLEDVARGLGIVKRDIKGGVQYVRPHKVNLQRWLCGFGLIKSEKDELPEFIPENVFYKLCFKANNPTAVDFQNLVTDEILPAIRKHGMYATPQALERMLDDPQTMIVTLQALMAEREARKSLEARAAQDKPKVIFADVVAASQSTILIGCLAKLLKQNGVDIGQNRLFERLRNDGYLTKTGEHRNLPTQRAMEMGLFEVKERTVVNPDGSIRITMTTMVTGKGQIYFVNRYRANATPSDRQESIWDEKQEAQT